MTLLRSVGAVALLGGALAGCGGSSGSGSAATPTGGGSAKPAKAAATAVNIQVYPGTVWSVPVYAAQAKGFFAKEGISANLVPATTGPAAIAALASGSVDTISVSPEVIMGAIGRGLKAQVWTGTMTSPWDILLASSVTPRGGGYPSDLKTLEGLTVGVPAIPSAGQGYVEANLVSAGLKTTAVKYVPVGIGPSSLAALETGQIQALVIQQPISEEAILKAHARVLADSVQGQLPPSLQGPYLGQWSNASYIASHAAVIKRLHAALDDAYNWLRSGNNVSAVASFLHSTYNVPGLNYTDMANADRQLWTNNYTAHALQTWDQYDYRYGFIKQPVNTTGLLFTGS